MMRKKLFPPERHGWLSAISMALAVLALALLLDACGGGTDVAGVGSGGTGTASGTVSGFGSVIVDGVEYADTRATVQRQDGSGSPQTASLQLGQRVLLVFDGSNTASRIEVQAQLAGPVGSAPDADGWMQVLGQWVRVVQGTADATRSTATVLGGYASASAIASGDPVEVFGAWAWDSRKSAQVLVATRIAQLTAAPALLQLGGVVQGLDSSTGSFRLNAASGTLVQSSALPSDLANGQVVQVWATAAAAASSPVVASRVARAELGVAEVGDAASGQSLRLGGLASQFDASSRTLVVQGTTVQLASSLVLDTATMAALARGEFVSLQVQRVGSTLVASTAQLRNGSAPNGDLGGTTVLIGTTSGIDWSASSLHFSLRGVDVQATASVVDSSCRSLASSARVSVRVQGSVRAPGQPVTASQVVCSAA